MYMYMHFILYMTVESRTLDGYQLLSLEYVQVTMTLSHERRGDLEIRLVCPSNTYSVIGAARPLDV